MRVHTNSRQIFRDAKFDGVFFQAGERDRFTQELPGIAPFADWLKKARLQPSGVEQMIDRSGQTGDSLLQFRAIRMRLLQRGGHGGERRLQLVRDRVEKCFLKFLRLAGDLRGPASFQSALFVDEESELRSKGVEQFALLKCR